MQGVTVDSGVADGCTGDAYVQLADGPLAVAVCEDGFTDSAAELLIPKGPGPCTEVVELLGDVAELLIPITEDGVLMARWSCELVADDDEVMLPGRLPDGPTASESCVEVELIPPAVLPVPWIARGSLVAIDTAAAADDDDVPKARLSLEVPA